MSKIEAGRVTLNPTTFDLQALIRDVETMFRARIEARDLQFSTDIAFDLPRFVVGDENKLRQIFINLLGNAVKFTRQGQIVWRLQMNGDRQNGRRLVAEVEDTGPGIAADDIGRLFEPFEQTRVGARMAGGSGLGLAISQQFARLMGGQITATSEVGQGSCFRVEVGVQDAQGLEAMERPAPRRVVGLKPGQGPYRVLVADDQQESRILLSEMLKAVGFDVLEVRDGREALACFERWKPHLILMDMRMPVMDGYEACRDIKATDEGRRTAIVAVTANAFDDTRQQVFEAGVDAYLRKPFREHELLEVIRTCLPVQYLYEGDTAAPVVVPVGEETSGPEGVAARIAALPPDLVEAMRQATIRADLRRLRGLIREVEKRSPQVAAHLLELANRYQYVVLRRLLEGELCVK
jgi:CheY-like chemotaxis protein